MERERENPCSPKDGCHHLLMSTQDWRCNGSEMLSHKSIRGKPASFHMVNIPSKQGIFVETQGTPAVGRVEWLCPQRVVFLWRNNTHAPSQMPSLELPTETPSHHDSVRRNWLPCRSGGQPGIGKDWWGLLAGFSSPILQMAKGLGERDSSPCPAHQENPRKEGAKHPSRHFLTVLLFLHSRSPTHGSGPAGS